MRITSQIARFPAPPSVPRLLISSNLAFKGHRRFFHAWWFHPLRFDLLSVPLSGIHSRLSGIQELASETCSTIE
jgi:hypothetical protein